MKTENFKDGRNPQDKGDMARHGLKGKSISQLKKIRSSNTASKRKKQLAHWYINMHSEETKGTELVHHGQTTKNFDICPSALKAFDKNQKDEMGDKDGFHDAVVAVDKYLGIEKRLTKKGSASQDDMDSMTNAVNDAKQKIKKAGLPGHTYHQIHLDAVKKLMKKKTFKEYMYDYGTPEATKLAKKMTPGQNEDRREKLRSKMANIGKQMGKTAADINKTIGKEPEPKMKKPADSMFKSHPKYEGKKKGLTISKVRSKLYKGAKTLGDISALRKKKVGQRIGRRIAGKIASRAMRSLF